MSYQRMIVAIAECVACGSEVTEICKACEVSVCEHCHKPMLGRHAEDASDYDIQIVQAKIHGPETNQSYIIQDWAGNTIQHNGLFNRGCYGRERGVPKTFESFDDGWDYIWGELTDRFGLTEEDYQEYYVVEA